MFVMGSYAAALRGQYPDWRQTPPGDIDLFGSKNELLELIEGLKAHYAGAQCQPSTTPDHYGIWITERLDKKQFRSWLIEYSVLADDLLSAMTAAPDAGWTAIAGFELRIVSGLADTLIKRAMVGLRPPENWSKHRRDIQYQKQHGYFGQSMTAADCQAFRLWRKHMRSQYAPAS